MPRKKLSVKEKKSTNLKKKLQVKKTKGTNISFLFDLEKPIFSSATIITDDYNVALILEDTDDFLLSNKLDSKVNTFEVDTNDLQIEFNRLEKLDYEEEDDYYRFEPIGIVNKKIIDWFISSYPLCAFYQIDKWFGKSVNTLVIVLAEDFGKPVGILKTTE